METSGNTGLPLYSIVILSNKMATDLDNYKLKNELEKLKAAIVKFTPDNDGLVNTVKGLTPKNNILINNLIEAWRTREIPELSEKDIIKQNLDYQSRPKRLETLAQVGLDTNDLVNEKRWILKNADGWYGWIPDSQAYTNRPLIYGGDLDYEKKFEKKVLKYQVSGTINLYRTMKKFLETFIKMGLTNSQICDILLELCKKHVPHQYSSLARHTDNAEKLWIELASSLNNDVEEAKVRKALCGISRKVAEPINLPLFDIKSLYDQILDLTHPGLDPAIHEEKATQHACKCIEFLVSKGIKQLFDNYQRDKVVHNEKINLVELVNIITQQENTRDEYKITQTLYLPPACSRLDIQPDVNTSSEQIVIMRNETYANKRDKQQRILRSRSNSITDDRRESKDRVYHKGYSGGDKSPRYSEEKPYFRRNYSREARIDSSQSRRNQPKYEQRDKSDERYKSYGSKRLYEDASPYRNDTRREASPYQGDSKRDQYNNSYRSDRYRRESRSPDNRYSNNNNKNGQSPVAYRRKSIEPQRRDSRHSPARDGQPQQRGRSSSRDGVKDKCRRCGAIGHMAERCEMFPYWRGKPCDCGLLHRRKDCNSSHGAFVTEMEPQERRGEDQKTDRHMYLN